MGCGLDFNSVNAALTRKPFFSLHRKRKPHLIGRILMMRRGSGICLDMGLGAEGLLDGLCLPRGNADVFT